MGAQGSEACPAQRRGVLATFNLRRRALGVSSWQSAFPDEACKAQSAKEYVFALPFKKHLGETLEEVMRKDLGYVECIVSTVRIDKLASLLNTALAELEWACGLRKI